MLISSRGQRGSKRLSECLVFELNEPAAKSHTPEGWPIRSIEIKPSDKAPKTYGTGVLRFYASLTLSVILPRRGWKLVKRNKTYAYLIPPPGQSAPYFISIAVPTAEECVALAHRSYARGHSWMGQLGEWPAWYFHERNMDVNEMWRDRDTGEMQSRLHKGIPKSNLIIGEWGAWEAQVAGTGGSFTLESYPAIDSNVGSDAGMAQADLTEGAARAVELTTFERNATARRLCLEHYGTTCQACGLKYEDKYGAIGAGLIHVHHIVPLSDVGAEYQIDPVRDLIPLCACCHHVAHRRTPPYTVAEIRGAIDQQRKMKSTENTE